MTRSKRIRPVVEIAENRERDAARQLGVSRQSVAEQERRLEELLQYREEYNQRLTGEGSNRMGARKLQEYQVFLSRLNQAVEQQKLLLAKVKRECDEKSQHWAKHRTHAKVMNKVEERYLKQERHQEDKQDQKEMDEHALRRYQTVPDEK